MTANVALTDTFDQWRVKDNELIIMTQPSGMNNFIKVLDTANSTTNTSGSIITAGGLGVAKSVNIGENLKVWGNIICVGDTTVHGNLVFGDATTDIVSFEADINTDIIPNTTLLFNLGNTTQYWANTFTGHITASQSATSGKPALTIEALDVDQIAVDVNASTQTANAVDISADAITSGTAFKLSCGAITSGVMMDLVSAATITGTGLNVALDSLTTGKVVNISADGLTSGTALSIDSNSADVTARHLVSVINDNSAASGAIPIYVRQDGVAPAGKFAGTTSLVVPAGTASNRGTGVQGGIRFNTEYSYFEGYTGAIWTQFGRLEDVDEDTWIRAETTAGADNDDLVFTTAGTQRMMIDQAGQVTMDAPGTATGNLDILSLTNTINHASMAGTETSILWNQWYNDGTPATADSGRISVGTETSWTAAVGTHDSYMAFETCLNGTVTERMRIEGGGDVGIGTTNPTTALTVNGTITELSSRTLKTNITNMEPMLPAILQMQGVKYDHKDPTKGENVYGFIAEDVDKILPNLVSHDKDGNAAGIQYTKMAAVLLEAIKEQQVQIEELKSKILN
jgi:hypothetical protein